MTTTRFQTAAAAVALFVGCGTSNGAPHDAAVGARPIEAPDASQDDSSEPPAGTAVCPPTMAEFCAIRGNGPKCGLTWNTAQQAACFPTCGGVQFFDCQGLHVANCPGDEGGGETYYFDFRTGALVAISRNASIVPGGFAGCYAGPAALKDSLFRDGSTFCSGDDGIYACPGATSDAGVWFPDADPSNSFE